MRRKNTSTGIKKEIKDNEDNEDNEKLLKENVEMMEKLVKGNQAKKEWKKKNMERHVNEVRMEEALQKSEIDEVVAAA